MGFGACQVVVGRLSCLRLPRSGAHRPKSLICGQDANFGASQGLPVGALGVCGDRGARPARYRSPSSPQAGDRGRGRGTGSRVRQPGLTSMPQPSGESRVRKARAVGSRTFAAACCGRWISGRPRIDTGMTRTRCRGRLSIWSSTRTIGTTLTRSSPGGLGRGARGCGMRTGWMPSLTTTMPEGSRRLNATVPVLKINARTVGYSR
jgi:hypothetical protein